jgi:hypothetical protein
MRSRFSGSLLLLLVLVSVQTLHAKPSSETLARQATSADPAEAARAIAELREQGPAGLEALRQVHSEEINRQIANPLVAATPEWQRLSLALDTVSQQKDSYLSGLYWYTDLNQARAAARAAGKPILSLRLLGKLNEEFSCANSRFFRTILYSNEEIGKTLTEKFILHWESVRPAPRVTIDFGDGRKLERTLTGNSIHYVLDADGRTLEALPGLYGPAAFLRELGSIEALFQFVAKKKYPDIEFYSNHHRQQLNQINFNWLSDIKQTGGKVPEGFVVRKRADGSVQAVDVASLAITKMITEETILRSMTATPEALGKVTDEATWKEIANLHIADATLDPRSIGLIRRQTQKAVKVDGTGKNADITLEKLIGKLQMSIALDTVRNEYLMHTKLYAWLIADRGRSDIDTLNKKVYAELFLSPASDPWLGLFSPETYVAIDGGGISR